MRTARGANKLLDKEWYIPHASIEKLKQQGFKWNYAVDGYVYSFPVATTENGNTAMECWFTYFVETDVVRINVFNVNCHNHRETCMQWCNNNNSAFTEEVDMINRQVKIKMRVLGIVEKKSSKAKKTNRRKSKCK